MALLETVGRYRIDDRIGEGAMADVYRAFDPHIARPLAVKLLKREFLKDRQYADRFLREAKAAGALSHPNIVTVFDVGEADGTPYIVMELLDGRPLDQVLADGPLDAATTLRIGIQLAEALAFAHGQHVVHRDIKPSNIVLGTDGTSVKLLDFGIARVGDLLFDAESVRTQAGQVLGTPRYMSPEQALGGEIDGRSDLFSLGLVLYEMLSGKRAFPGGSSATLAIQIVQRDPETLATVAPATPGGLQFIVSKLLAKQPDRRFADGYQLADAMRKELAALTAAGVEEEARHTYLPIQLRLPILLGAITALLLIGAIWTVLSHQYEAMEEVALASGNAISSFVASNAALRAVENATLPAGQQDWAPVEAFVRSASDDPAIRRIVVVGADGVVRASSDTKLTGRPYAAPTGGVAVTRRPDLTITSQEASAGSGSFRFVRPILYAGRTFGQVDVEVSREALDNAAGLARILLIGLGLVTVGGVALTSYLGARALAVPMRRLKTALLDVARGNLDFRISHTRRDEFGELFDGFNLAAGALQERIGSIEQLALNAPSAGGGAERAGSGPTYAMPMVEADIMNTPPAAVAEPETETETEVETETETEAQSPLVPPVLPVPSEPPAPIDFSDRTEIGQPIGQQPVLPEAAPILAEPQARAHELEFDPASPSVAETLPVLETTPPVAAPPVAAPPVAAQPVAAPPPVYDDDDDSQDTLIGPAIRR